MRQFHDAWRHKMPLIMILSLVVAPSIVMASAEEEQHFVMGDMSIQPTLNLEPLEYDIKLEIRDNGRLFDGEVDIIVKFKSPKTPIENLFSEVHRSLGARSIRSDPAPRDRIMLHKTEGLEVVANSIKVMAAESMEKIYHDTGDVLPIKPAITLSKEVVAIDLVRNMPLDSYGKISLKYNSTTNSNIHHGTIFDPITNQHNDYIASHLEIFEAHHLFPCFSDPNFKAKITLSVTKLDKETVVASNMPMELRYTSETDFDIPKLKHFTTILEQTDTALPLSSLTFALGDYKKLGYWYSDQSMNYAKVNLFEPSGHPGEGDYAYDFAIEAVAWIQKHFELESTGLSLKNINLVAVPSYEAWRISDGHGVALIDHDLLLIDKSISSPQRKIEAVLNVAHAIARQWFGHTVLPHSKEDAWITDGLALHTALRIVNDIKPQFKINQYVQNRHYRRIMFDMVGDKDRRLSPRDRVFLEQLKSKSVFDLLQANVIPDESRFDKIIRSLVVETLTTGLNQADLVEHFGSKGYPKEEINKIINAKRDSTLGKRLYVDLSDDAQSVTITRPDETSVVWPVEMRLRLSSFDGTRTRRSILPMDQLASGKRKIEMKLPDWFSLSEDNWLKLDLGNGQILPYHQLHYSDRILARLGKQIKTGKLLTPAEKIDILSQHLNTVGVISGAQGHKDVDSLVKLISYYKNEKDPDVLLEVLDAIKWARHWWRNSHRLYLLKKELKEIYRNLDGLKMGGDETISKKRAKSDAALMLMLSFFDEATERDAVEAYKQYRYKTPAFLRSAVFKGVHLHGIGNFESQDISQELASRLKTASLPEERLRIKEVDSSSY